MRNILVLTFVCVTFAVFCSTNAQPQVLSWGFKGPYDQPLLTLIAKESPSIIPFTKVVKDIDYPVKGVPPIHTITYIQVTSKYKKPNKGGTAYIKEGGVGQKTAKIHLKSDRGEGFEFLVEIYGI